jgi:hypothetical protein
MQTAADKMPPATLRQAEFDFFSVREDVHIPGIQRRGGRTGIHPGGDGGIPRQQDDLFDGPNVQGVPAQPVVINQLGRHRPDTEEREQCEQPNSGSMWLERHRLKISLDIYPQVATWEPESRFPVNRF